MKCPNCNSEQIFADDLYATVFRCHDCNYVGNKNNFI